MRTLLRLLVTGMVLLPLIAAGWLVTADDLSGIVIELSGVKPPPRCSPAGWVIGYRQKTSGGKSTPATLTRYVVQYVNDDLNLAHYWRSGYSSYAQDYTIFPGEFSVWTSVNYIVPLPSSTYRATTVIYVLHEQQVVWEIRAAINCMDGLVVSHSLTSQVASGNRDALPRPSRNLVLALGDIALDQRSAGVISACQTFYISDIVQARASTTVYGRESIAGTRLRLVGGPTLPIIDVAEDYGQPGGTPLVAQCVGK
jgi:hypothetical protein